VLLDGLSHAVADSFLDLRFVPPRDDLPEDQFADRRLLLDPEEVADDEQCGPFHTAATVAACLSRVWGAADFGRLLLDLSDRTWTVPASTTVAVIEVPWPAAGVHGSVLAGGTCGSGAAE